MRESEKFTEDVINHFKQKWERRNLNKIVLKHFRKLESSNLDDREKFKQKLKEFTNDFVNDIYNNFDWLYFEMFPDTPTKEIKDYTPVIEQVYKEFKGKEYLVSSTAYCIYLHRIMTERDKILLGSSKPQISPLEASNTKTDTKTPDIGEIEAVDVQDSDKIQIKDLSNTELALYCVLIGISPDKPMKAQKLFEQTGRKKFSELVTEMKKVRAKEFRIPEPGNLTIRQLQNRRTRYYKIRPLLPPEAKENAQNEIIELTEVIENS